MTIETFVSLTTLIFVVTSKLNDDVGDDDDEFQNSSVQTDSSVKLPATGVAVVGGGSFVVIVCVLDVEPMSCGVTTIPPPPVSLSTPSDSAGRKTLFLMLMVVVVTSLLPSSVLVDVFGISSITDCVKSLKRAKIMFELTRLSACIVTLIRRSFQQFCTLRLRGKQDDAIVLNFATVVSHTSVKNTVCVLAGYVVRVLQNGALKWKKKLTGVRSRAVASDHTLTRGLVPQVQYRKFWELWMASASPPAVQS